MTLDNLWKAFWLLPGTRWARIALTVWEALLGVICWAGGAWYGAWGLLALPIAFLLHEVLFRAWVRHIARIPDAEDGDTIGVTHAAVLTMERWIGPVA